MTTGPVGDAGGQGSPKGFQSSCLEPTLRAELRCTGALEAGSREVGVPDLYSGHPCQTPGSRLPESWSSAITLIPWVL